MAEALRNSNRNRRINRNTATSADEGADVSINANPYTGYAVYDSLAFQGQSGWQVIGGTSAGAPQWSALVAIADQGRVLRGAGTLDGATGTLPAIYSTYNASQYNSAFNDITVGRSSWFVSAGPHWDEVTGLGSPKGNFIANTLAGFGLSPSSSASTTAGNSTTTPSPSTPTLSGTPKVWRSCRRRLPFPRRNRCSRFSVQSNSNRRSIWFRPDDTDAHNQSRSGGEIGEGASALSGNGAGGSGHFQLTNSGHADDDSTIMPSHIISGSNSNPLRHLLGAHANDQAFGPARPGRIFAPSSYDSASFAANRDDSDNALTWQQLAALIGTGVLVGSYAMEAQRRKRALMSNWPGIDSRDKSSPQENCPSFC